MFSVVLLIVEISKCTNMNNIDLIALQDSSIDSAKKRIMEDGQLHQFGVILIRGSQMDELFSSGFSMEFLNSKDMFRPESKDGASCLVVSIDPSWEKLFGATCILYPEMAQPLNHVIEMGKAAFGVPESEIYERTMRVFLKVNDLSSKDITSGIIRLICQKVDAFAVIMISEAWQLLAETKESLEKETSKGSFADNPKSIEILASFLDASSFRRILTVGIKRDESGDIVGFEDIQESMDNKDGEAAIGGRFIEFLKPISTIHS